MAKSKTEKRTIGYCKKCGRCVIRIDNSEQTTCRADGRRYIYAHKPDDGGCLFRCECMSVIDDNWIFLGDDL